VIKKKPASFWGRNLFLTVFLNLVILIFASQCFAENNSTIVTLEASGPVAYREHFFTNPSRLVLNFAPKTLHSGLADNIVVNRGIIKSIHCDYYRNSGWLKSVVFFLLADASYIITQGQSGIEIAISNISATPVKLASGDELVIKDYMPSGWGSSERGMAVASAVNFIKIKRQALKKLTGVTDSSVLVEKDLDDTVRITATNMTPTQMMATGAKVFLNQPVRPYQPINIIPQAFPKAGSFAPKPYDFAGIALGLASVMLGVFVMGRIREKPAAATIKKDKVDTNKLLLEELFLKYEDIDKLSKEQKAASCKTTATIGDAPEKQQEASSEIFNFPTLPSDIAERRRFPRADIRNTRGILNRALIGSRTQPFKNIKINDISKGGLCFQVKSRETAFKAPTVIKLYFSSATKPVDLWAKVMWEKDDPVGDGKNVGVKYTRVPKETWEQIINSFGHRLG